MRGWLLWTMALCLALPLPAQTSKKIKELQTRRGELQKEIAEGEQMLLSTKKDVRSQLAGLNALTGQIESRKKLIGSIQNDMKSMDSEMVTLQGQLAYLQRQLADRKKKYATALRYAYKNRSIQEKLMFIFSADDLSKTYRRLRYVREYGNYQRRQADEIERKKVQIQDKQKEVLAVRQEKENLLQLQTAEQDKLTAQEQQQRTMVNQLQKKQRNLQNEISRKRSQANRLNAQIDRLIEAEIEAARKRAEAEARRKAAENAAKRKEQSKEKTERNKNNPADKSAKVRTKKDIPSAPVETYHVDDSDRKLSGSFARNKGALPAPITGGYLVVGHFGLQGIAGMKHVELDNKGIDLQGRPGAQARAIFDGEVSAVFQYNGMTNVLVRHGSYISVYCNLSFATVKRGDKVSTRQSLGPVAKDESGNIILHFQLRRETTKLNPEAWLRL